jgi:glycosyltransferase involved in cell wall biosynthesis
MRILCVNCVISEFGGVEFAALNLARKLAERGHEVHVLGALGAEAQLAPKDDNATDEARATGGLQLHFRRFPRIYPLGEQHGSVRKLIWHVQDLLHPANERIFGEVLREVSPDIVLLHNITAIGLNIWRTIAKAGIPCVQVVHDLALVCMNMSQFRGGAACEGLCTACKAYKRTRFSMIGNKDRFSFVAPSQGILDAIGRYVDLSPWPSAVISNANTFEVRPRQPVLDPPELLYVGRLDPAKGITMMLEAAALARRRHTFRLNLLGSGSLEADLHRRYAGSDWVSFHGSVSQERVAEFMSRARLLLIPSLWPETVPGVAVHALYAGLPALGSRIGGIPEHIIEGGTGFLLPPGNMGAWRDGIEHALDNPALLDAFSAEGPRQAQRFDAERAVTAYEQFMTDLVQSTRASQAL